MAPSDDVYPLIVENRKPSFTCQHPSSHLPSYYAIDYANKNLKKDLVKKDGSQLKTTCERQKKKLKKGK